MAEERLQKVLARAGVASRRAAEALITAGRVRVNGRIVSELGVRVAPRARVEVDGRLVVAEPLVYIVLHKPRGVVCTLRDPEGRPTVAEYLKDVGARVVPVGRLDFHTSGALICTNDGELASHLMHPRHHAKKEYVAKVSGVVDERSLARLRERIVIDGRATQPAEVNLLRVEEGKSWLSVKLGEGRNRQVRKLGEHAGVPVMRLARVAHAGITAEGLRPGEWRRLTLDELRSMKQEYGLPRRIHAVDPLADSRGGRVTLRKPRAAPGRGRDLNDKPHGAREHSRNGDFNERPGHARRHGESVERPRHGRPQAGRSGDFNERPGHARRHGESVERPRHGRPHESVERPRHARPQGGRSGDFNERPGHARRHGESVERPRHGRPQGGRSGDLNERPRQARPHGESGERPQPARGHGRSGRDSGEKPRPVRGHARGGRDVRRR